MKILWNDGTEEENTEEPEILSTENEEDAIYPFKHGILSNPGCLDLLVGNVVYWMLGSLVIVLFFFEWKILLGYFVGFGMACGMTVHMTVTIEQALHIGEFGAEKHMKKGTALRYSVITVLFCVIGITGIVNLVAAMIGVMILKVSAYSQPLTHKWILKFLEKGR